MLTHIVALLLTAGSFEYKVETVAAPAQTILRLKGDARALAASPDGKWLALGVKDWVAVVEFQGGTQVWATELGPGYVRGLAFSPDGKRLVAASIGGVRVLDARTGKQLWQAQGHPDPMQKPPFSAYGAAFVPDGSEVWTISASDQKVRRWSAADGSTRGELDTGLTSPRQILAGAGGLVVAGDSQGLVCFEPSGQARWRLTKGSIWGSLAFSEAGKLLMVGFNRGGAAIAFLDPLKGEQRGALMGLGEGEVSGLAWIKENQVAAAVSRSGVLLTKVPAKNEAQKPASPLDPALRPQLDAVPALVLGLSGSTMAVAGKDKTVRLYPVP